MVVVVVVVAVHQGSLVYADTWGIYNDSNTRVDVVAAVIMAKCIVWVYAVHVMSANDEAINPQTKPINKGCESACRLQSTIFTILYSQSDMLDPLI